MYLEEEKTNYLQIIEFFLEKIKIDNFNKEIYVKFRKNFIKHLKSIPELQNDLAYNEEFIQSTLYKLDNKYDILNEIKQLTKVEKKYNSLENIKELDKNTTVKIKQIERNFIEFLFYINSNPIRQNLLMKKEKILYREYSKLCKLKDNLPDKLFIQLETFYLRINYFTKLQKERINDMKLQYEIKVDTENFTKYKNRVLGLISELKKQPTIVDIKNMAEDIRVFMNTNKNYRKRYILEEPPEKADFPLQQLITSLTEKKKKEIEDKNEILFNEYKEKFRTLIDKFNIKNLKPEDKVKIQDEIISHVSTSPVFKRKAGYTKQNVYLQISEAINKIKMKELRIDEKIKKDFSITIKEKTSELKLKENYNDKDVLKLEEELNGIVSNDSTLSKHKDYLSNIILHHIGLLNIKFKIAKEIEEQKQKEENKNKPKQNLLAISIIEQSYKKYEILKGDKNSNMYDIKKEELLADINLLNRTLISKDLLIFVEIQNKLFEKFDISIGKQIPEYMLEVKKNVKLLKEKLMLLKKEDFINVPNSISESKTIKPQSLDKPFIKKDFVSQDEYNDNKKKIKQEEKSEDRIEKLIEKKHNRKQNRKQEKNISNKRTPETENFFQDIYDTLLKSEIHDDKKEEAYQIKYIDQVRYKLRPGGLYNFKKFAEEKHGIKFDETNNGFIIKEIEYNKEFNKKSLTEESMIENFLKTKKVKTLEDSELAVPDEFQNRSRYSQKSKGMEGTEYIAKYDGLRFINMDNYKIVHISLKERVLSVQKDTYNIKNTTLYKVKTIEMKTGKETERISREVNIEKMIKKQKFSPYNEDIHKDITKTGFKEYNKKYSNFEKINKDKYMIKENKRVNKEITNL